MRRLHKWIVLLTLNAGFKSLLSNFYCGVVLTAARIVQIFLIGLSFVFFHEFGHFIFAQAMDLNPSFQYKTSDHSSVSGLFGLSMGVAYKPTAVLTENFFVVLGATAVPLVIAILALFAYAKTSRPEFGLIVEIYMILIIVNMIPIPGSGNLDANKIWNAVFH